jgi:hypothetical protein
MGDLLWIAHGASIAGGVTSVGVAVFGSTSVYITGWWASSGASNTLQIYTNGVANPSVTRTGYNTNTGFTLKFDAATGNSLWCTRCTQACLTYGIALDSDENVYMTGTWGFGNTALLVFYNSFNQLFATTLAIFNTGGNAFLVKYDKDGLVQWVTRAGSTTGGTNAYGIAVGSNSVYITGGYTGTLDAYHAGGVSKYTTASLTQIGGSDIFVIKYDLAGAVQWVAKGGSGFADNGRSIAVDGSNNVYLTGECTGNLTFYEKDKNTNPSATINQVGAQDLFVAKYTAAGVFSWGKQFGSAGADNAWSIAWSASSFVYVTGRFASNFIGSPSLTGTNAMYVLGLAGGTGNVSASNSAVSATGWIVVRKPNGNVFVGGNYTAATMTLATNGTTAPGFVTEYNPSTLVFQKATAIGSTATTPTSTVNGLAYDGNNYIYAVGTFTNHISVFSGDTTTKTGDMHTETGTNTGYFVSKYTYGGDLVWSRSGLGSVAVGNAICVSPDGSNVYAAGYFTGTLHDLTTATQQMFIVRYDQNGTQGWVVKGGAVTKSDVNAIKADADYVYAAGSFIGNWNPGTGQIGSAGTDAWVAKFRASDGVALWIAKASATGTDWAAGLAIDASSNVYITGQYTGSALSVFSQGGSSVAFTVTSATTNMYLVKYTSSGVAQWGARASSSSSIGNAVATDPITGDVYVTGTCASGVLTVFASDGTTNVAYSVGTGLSNNDVFLIKYSPIGALSWTTRMGTTGNDEGKCLAVDTAGNVYVGGHYFGSAMVFYDSPNILSVSVSLPAPSAGAPDGWVAKYTPAGQAVWAARCGNTNNAIAERCNAVAIDPKGTCCVIGGQVASGPAQFYDTANVLYKQMAITNTNLAQIGFVSRVPLP